MELCFSALRLVLVMEYLQPANLPFIVGSSGRIHQIVHFEIFFRNIEICEIM